MSVIEFEGSSYELKHGESVLEGLLGAGHDVAHSCRAGACQTCLLQADGPIPENAQTGLTATEKALGYFLPCLCRPETPLSVHRPASSALRHETTVIGKHRLNAEVLRLRLRTPENFSYRPGQYLSLWQSDTLGRSYSLASIPGEDFLELHIRKLTDGRVSNWAFNQLEAGQTVQISRAIGDCFYLPGQPDQPLLLAGTSTGLAPLYGIVRDALSQGHQGPIHLLHGALTAQGLYYRDELAALAEAYPQLRCQAHALDGQDSDPTPIDEAALSLHARLADWRIFLCGAPTLVNRLRKQLFLAGADLRQIYADAFITAP